MKSAETTSRLQPAAQEILPLNDSTVRRHDSGGTPFDLTGRIVWAKSGRDKGVFFAVMKCERDKNGVWYYMLADGRTRLISAPKRKNGKHIAVTKASVPAGELNDAVLRRILHEYNFPEGRTVNG